MTRFADLYKIVSRFFRRHPGLGEPLTFLRGSQEELCRVTTWACHAHKSVFNKDTSLAIRYISSTRRARGHAILSFVEALTDTEVSSAISLMRLCDTIYECNCFTGTEWVCGPEPNEGIHVPELMASPGHIGLALFTGIYEKPLYLDVLTHAPTAQEYSEAVFSLREWLINKAPENVDSKLLERIFEQAHNELVATDN